jgi:6,7-dimethyl-8-ribityllumazine synthase
MPKVIEGALTAGGLRFAVVVSRFNHFITDRLLEGCLDTLSRHGADIDKGVSVIKVPGAFELPAAVKRAAQTDVDAVIAIGAVIRGDTPHFDFIAAEVTKGVAAVSLEAAVPVVYGIITTDTLEQAVERAGTKAGNKGGEAARSAIEMANLYRQLA